MANGEEIDRLTGFKSPAENYKNRLEETYKNENTLYNLKKVYEKNPGNFEIIAKLVQKYHSGYNLDKLVEFSKKLVKNPEEAKKLRINKISAYEFGHYALTYAAPEQVLTFVKMFPESELRVEGINNIRRFFHKPKLHDTILNIFDILLMKYPEDILIIEYYAQFCTETNTNIDNCIILIENLFKTQQEKISSGTAMFYVHLLKEKGYENKIQQLCETISHNKLTEIVYFFQRDEKYDQAFTILDHIIHKYPNNYNFLYAYGKNAVLSGKNIDLGLEHFKKCLELIPKSNQHAHALVYCERGILYELKGDFYKARVEYEEAIKLDPNYKEAKESLKKLSEKY